MTWICIRTDLKDDPTVILLAKHLREPGGRLEGLSEEASIAMAILFLMELWGIFDAQAVFVGEDEKDGFIAGYTESTIDRRVTCHGFCHALVTASTVTDENSPWLIIDEKGATLPKFRDWMYETKKERQQAAARQRRKRSKENPEKQGESENERDMSRKSHAKSHGKKRDINRDKSVTKEKERKYIKEKENKKKKILEVPIPENLDSEDFKATWDEWIEHKFDIKDPLTPRAAKMALKRISAWGKVRAIAAIVHSIAAPYKGIFEEKTYGKPQAPVQEIEFKDVNRD